MVKDRDRLIEVEGKVLELLPNSKFLVGVEVGGKMHKLEGYLSGKMRRFSIRIMVGDTVKLLISPYSPKTGRIVYRSINRT